MKANMVKLPSLSNPRRHDTIKKGGEFSPPFLLLDYASQLAKIFPLVVLCCAFGVVGDTLAKQLCRFQIAWKWPLLRRGICRGLR
jgi:hypothetical protein